MPNTATDWITAISTAISAMAIILLWAQTRLLKNQSASALAQLELLRGEISDDHERARRENAISLMVGWTAQLQRETSSARRLVEALSEKQCIDLLAEKTLEVPAHLKPLVDTCLAGSDSLSVEQVGGQLRLQESQVAMIRWQAVRFLNGLEVVMAAWRHNTADREMLAEQFGYLVDETKGYTALAKLRKAAGGKDHFPSIAEFADHLERQRQQVANGKPKLGSH